MRNKYIVSALILIILLSGTSAVFAQQQDKDGDGIRDISDQCPTEAGPASNNGCPLIFVAPPTEVPDTDGDGWADVRDNCPTVPSTTNNGCPDVPPPNDPPTEPDAPSNDPDRDGDGIPDDRDRCPDEIGTSEFGGCPPPPAEPPFQHRS